MEVAASSKSHPLLTVLTTAYLRALLITAAPLEYHDSDMHASKLIPWWHRESILASKSERGRQRFIVQCQLKGEEPKIYASTVWSKKQPVFARSYSAVPPWSASTTVWAYRNSTEREHLYWVLRSLRSKSDHSILPSDLHIFSEKLDIKRTYFWLLCLKKRCTHE